MTGITYFNVLANALAANPPRAADAPIIARLAALGIGPGKTLDAPTVDPALRDGPGRRCSRRPRAAASYDPPGVRHVNGWHWTADTGRFGTNYTYRAFIAMTLLPLICPKMRSIRRRRSTAVARSSAASTAT